MKPLLFLYVLILLALSFVSIAVAQQILTARAWTTNENGAAYFCWDFVDGIPTYSNSIGGLIVWIERAFDLAGRDGSNTVWQTARGVTIYLSIPKFIVRFNSRPLKEKIAKWAVENYRCAR